VRTDDGEPDPHAYRGFFELLRNGRESVMRWTNLAADSPSLQEDGAAEERGARVSAEEG
jgi:hypothetical protein